MNRRANRNPPLRRGATVVAMISTMLVIALVLVGLVLGGARDQDLSIRRLETLRAFYAAEAGTNMAIREMMLSTDFDGDGTIGTISDDGNSANDPLVSDARVRVSKSVSGVQITLTSEGRCGAAKRKIETVLQ
jgi:hypothetical protein